MESLAERIARAFPASGPVEPLREIGEGSRSQVVETAAGVAVKVGRVPAASAAAEREWRALPLLAARLSVPVPRPRWRTPPCEAFPHGAIAYTALHGQPPPPHGSEALARDIGTFLAALHALPRSLADEAGLEAWDAHARELEARPVVMPVLARHLSPHEYRQLDAWWDALAAAPHFPATEGAICHHDLWHDNILVGEDGRLAAVLDWDHIDWSDPAHDLVPLRHFGETFATIAIAAYVEAGGRFDAAVACRVERYWELRDLAGLAFCIAYEDAAETLDAIRKVCAVHFGS